MFGGHFYHEKTRRAVAIFGKLFNNLYVIRKNQTTGASTSQVKVPLAYAPKNKYLDRIRENPNLDTDTKVAIKYLACRLRLHHYRMITHGRCQR